MTVTVTYDAIRNAWCRETSADPDQWAAENPALGQCAVTALVVQDKCGGELLRAENEGVSHYWNRVADGTEVDLTREQFATWQPATVTERSREYVLSFPATVRRYGLLRTRLQSRLTVVPLPLDEANLFVAQHHRHHVPVIGHKFSMGVADEQGEVRGIAIIGRPVSRGRDNGLTLEVTRVATDGCPNACSALYAAAWRATRALGYERLGTYTLTTEPGTSLRAAGWHVVGQVTARSWSCSSRPRVDKTPLQGRLLWEPVA